jgi:hypothetical protein
LRESAEPAVPLPAMVAATASGMLRVRRRWLVLSATKTGPTPPAALHMPLGLLKRALRPMPSAWALEMPPAKPVRVQPWPVPVGEGVGVSVGVALGVRGGVALGEAARESVGVGEAVGEAVGHSSCLTTWLPVSQMSRPHLLPGAERPRGALR